MKVRRMFSDAGGFHAYKSVAPLKRFRAGPGEHSFHVFPRLQKRGPIEAKHSQFTSSIAEVFPRLQKRGPIEAAHDVGTPFADHLFPRLQKRGPIEAIHRSGQRDSNPRVSTLTKAWPH